MIPKDPNCTKYSPYVSFAQNNLEQAPAWRVSLTGGLQLSAMFF